MIMFKIISLMKVHTLVEGKKRERKKEQKVKELRLDSYRHFQNNFGHLAPWFKFLELIRLIYDNSSLKCGVLPLFKKRLVRGRE